MIRGPTGHPAGQADQKDWNPHKVCVLPQRWQVTLSLMTFQRPITEAASRNSTSAGWIPFEFRP